MLAALYIPDFAVQAVLRSQPALAREQPLAVLEGVPPLLRVMAVNESARAAGVEIGMTKLQAEAMPNLVMRRRSLFQEQSAQAALLDCACAFSPRVEATAADTMLVDLEGLERLFGSPAAVACELVRRAAALSLECNVAVAANLEAAIHAAHGFSGATVILSGSEAERLGSLPLEILVNAGLINAAPIGSKAKRSSARPTTCPAQELLEIFDRWGVRTFRAFALLPTIAVAERLGQQGVALQKLARGEGLRHLAPTAAPLRFEEALELEHAIENLESLAFALGRLLEQLCARLQGRSLATNELRLQLELEDISEKILNSPRENTKNIELLSYRAIDPTITQSFLRVLRLPVPIRDARVLLKLWQLELSAHPPQAPVTKIFLAAEPAPPQIAQHGLFLPLEPQPERLELMLARIAGIVGSVDPAGPKISAIATSPASPTAAEAAQPRAGSPALLDSDRPDAFRMQRFSAAHNPGNQSSNSTVRRFGNHSITPSHHHTISLALRLFRPPRPATVELRAGVPVHVSCAAAAGPRGDIIWCAGPWRSSGEWWNRLEDENRDRSPEKNGEWSREEWDVRIAGALYRLVRDVRSGAWNIDGTYD